MNRVSVMDVGAFVFRYELCLCAVSIVGCFGDVSVPSGRVLCRGVCCLCVLIHVCCLDSEVLDRRSLPVIAFLGKFLPCILEAYFKV